MPQQPEPPRAQPPKPLRAPPGPITRLDVILGALVVIVTIVASHYFPWPWFVGPMA